MDSRTIELIHGDIDGENSPDEQRELILRLEASAEARREHEQLRRLSELIDAEAVFEPPSELRAAILSRMARPVAPVIPLRRPRTWLGAAAALAATAAGVALLLGRAPQLPEIDPSVLAGTIGGSGADKGVVSMQFDEGPISGAIRLHRSQGAYAIEIDLAAARPVAIVAGTAGAALGLEGFVRIDGEPDELEEADGRVRMLHRGSQHYAVVLRSDGSAPLALDLAIYEGDQLIRQGHLVWPADTPHRSR
jgi:hypothetical protein